MAVERKDIGIAIVMTCTVCKKEEKITKTPPFFVIPRETNFRRIHAKCDQGSEQPLQNLPNPI